MAAAGALVSHCAAQTIQPAGWFDVAPSIDSARLADFDLQPSGLLFLFSSKTQSEAVVLGSDHREAARWRLGGRRRMGRLFPNRRVALEEPKRRGVRQVCEYTLAGQRLDRCYPTGDEIASIEVAGAGLIGLGDQRIHYLAPKGNAAHEIGALFLGEPPWLTASDGRTLFAVSEVDATLTAVNLTDASRGYATLLSPRLAAANATRLGDPAVVARFTASNQRVFCVPGGYRIAEGLPVEVFSSRGAPLAALTLTVPRFGDLRRAPAKGSRPQDPIGYPAANFLRVAGSRLYLVDQFAVRVVYYELPGE
ncbi:MAG TPA: hypothetical protein DEH78_14170 [Solibacterales bacterium]|nr:hypothetical protein [Bryobacterales bacterium]